jgi:hypothetical protein
VELTTMQGLELNPEACRLLDRMSISMRGVIRHFLRARFAEAWEERGLPPELLGFLIQRRAREMSINWNLPASSTVLDYAGFGDLFEILAAHAELMRAFVPLSLDENLLRLRFLELETLRNRVAYARPISEAEVGTLRGFDERLQKVAKSFEQLENATANAVTPGTVDHESVAPPVEQKPPATPLVPSPPPAVSVQPEPAVSVEVVLSTAMPSPEEIAAQARPIFGASQPLGVPPEPAPASPAAPRPPEPRAPAGAVPAAVSPSDLEIALARGTDDTILAALYYEVTGLADAMWSGSLATQSTRVWERVRESSWYSEGFSRLGLRVISDFYGLLGAAREIAGAQSDRKEVQDLLREHNFAQLLLGLRDFFSRVRN